MTRNLQSQSKLTEFAPLSPEQEEGSRLGHLFYRFFKRPTADEKSDNGSDSRSGSGNGNEDSGVGRKDVVEELPWEESKPSQHYSGEDESQLEDRTNETESDFRLDVSEGRSLPNVLKRISNLLALKNTGGGRRSYNDTELKQYWMPDSVSKECYDCGERFTTFRRRHHCRVCGQIFCAKCCNQEIPGKIMNCTGDLRVCMYCGKVVLSYVQSADLGGELSADLKALHHDLHTKFGGGGRHQQGVAGMDGNTAGSSMASPPDQPASSAASPTPPTSLVDSRDEPVKRKHSLGYREEKFAFARSNSETSCQERSRTWLRSLMDEAVVGLEASGGGVVTAPGAGALHLHRHRLRAYPINHHYTPTIQASHLIDWLVQHGKANNRIEGVALGQAMVECGYLEPLERSYGQFFESGSLYTVVPSTIAVPNLPEEDIKRDSSAESESEFLSSETNLPASNSIFNLNLNLEDKTAHVSKPPPPSPPPAAVEAEPITPPPSPPPSPRPSDAKDGVNAAEDDRMNLRGGGSGKKETVARSGGENACEIGVRAVVEVYNRHQEGGTSPSTLALQPVHWNDIQPESLTHDSPHKHAYNALRCAFDQHLGSYLRQLLIKEGVSQSWAGVISSLCRDIVKIVKPDFSRLDEMDIRQYVQFKKVSGGERSECEIVEGVVCSKNVAHRAMPTTIRNPKILLLSCPIVYQRVEGKFLSLEPVIMQEQDYIGHTVARIAALGADLVVVGRNVSRLAQEALLALGMSLVLNVKATVLERMARATGADILTSVDSHVGRPKLGTCALFHLRTFDTDVGGRKTLMVVEGCPVSELGCTVLLRGGSVDELAKIKRIAQGVLFAEYNAALEFSYLLDAHASPPSPPPHDTFFTDDPTPDLDSQQANGDSSTSQSSYAIANAKDIEDGGDSTMEGVKSLSSGLSSGEEVEDTLPFVKKLSAPPAKPRDRLSSEERTKVVNSEAVSDFSDPLRSYLNSDEDVTPNNSSSSTTDNRGGGTADNQFSSLSVTELPLSNKFRKALEDNILSISPYLKFSLPYLESESGRNCALRSYFGQKVFWSSQLYDDIQKTRGLNATLDNTHTLKNRYENIKLKEEHRFVREHLTEAADSLEVRTLVAEFRACGGRIALSSGVDARPGAHQQAAELRQKQPVLLPGHKHLSPSDSLRAMDVLEPDNHQTLSVLFCSYSPISHNAPSFCVDPWVVDMELYGRNDIPLGAFLERYCFRREYVCPSERCDVAMLEHTRRFVHDGGAVHVALRLLPILDQPQPQLQPPILMWTCCTHCNTVTPIVAMSPATWRLSFAKYLELRFHGNMYTMQALASPACPHSLHQDHVHYFTQKNIVASFVYRRISVWEISLPPVTLETERELMGGPALLEEMKTWSLLGQQAFSQALSKLCSLAPATDSAVTAMKLQLQKDQAHFKARVDEVQTKISTLPNENGIRNEMMRKIWRIEDGVVNIKRLVAETIDEWNARLSEADAAIAAATRKKGASTAEDKKKPLNDAKQSSSTLSDIVVDGVSVVEGEPSGGKDSPDLVEAEEATVTDMVPVSDQPTPIHDTLLADPSLLTDPIIDPVVIHTHQCETIAGSTGGGSSDTRHQSTPLVSDKKTVKTILSQLLPTAPQNTYIQSPMSQCEHYCLPEGWPLPVVVYEREPSSIIAYTLTSVEYRTALDDITASGPPPDHHQPPPSPSLKLRSGSSFDSASGDTGGGSGSRSSATPGDQRVLRSSPSPTLASTAPPSAGPQPSTNPTTAVLGFLRNSSSSSMGSDKNSGGRRGSGEGSAAGVPPEGGGTIASVPVSNSTTAFSFSTPVQTVNTADDDPTFRFTSDDAKFKPAKNHQSPNIEVQFGDNCANFKVKVYFAEDFRRLRSLVLPHGEESFIRSLTRCVPWAATGGKSGSNFSKTKDDRFILKEMSRLETQLFIEFAPQYFTYMETCVRSRSPTLLGKIVGVYRVAYRNATNSCRSNLLVMEHLFHARLVTNKFDLKGSMRNRLVDTTSESERETVLLDENLINMTCDSPLYILPHSKTILMQAIHNDTQFLATQSVMDYSLLVGLDQSNKELVVGIIDYIRTFTWDKKLETMVKRYGLLGQGKQPTIISPDEYRDRFIAAMHRYFLPVPDRWTRLANGIDC